MSAPSRGPGAARARGVKQLGRRGAARRRMLEKSATVGLGLAAAAYVKPDFQSLGIPAGLAAPSGLGNSNGDNSHGNGNGNNKGNGNGNGNGNNNGNGNGNGHGHGK